MPGYGIWARHVQLRYTKRNEHLKNPGQDAGALLLYRRVIRSEL